ncbi:hypothetical protein [Pseudomonas syringae group genomosp. 3]|uniref:hypothetical protein n=1 Tax=Pseudomonas syringae group genomosp. 3 TaxID=251701 RepID=UPI0006E67339|nr:hypothetical protein [Pseudomonas syringae group genomosp. 3]KPW51670.1 Uncharacterized protein ALO86_04134 [Pseudomonas syringae pv. berberidis]KPY10977.1 Uncharacterized protein ALO54_00336 [Pseudomonas syringae pv. philadelphi]RMM36805.1 hypothetical protein ALQ83_00425 [Pseudomonas syringae pv. berberidis]RMP72446.1 hypothetical protein ALQ19_00086 [Pseudomonas syringae pv. berberidis]RMQ31637.1 hypothetical protein ALQ06_04599 [Pseudomonas syringae pv. berberidis]
MTMKVIKSMVFAVAALSFTSAFADDGNEFASTAADKMRMAQEQRFREDQSTRQNEQYVNSDENSRSETSAKSEG